MINNDVLVRVRFALNLRNSEVLEIFRLGHHPLELPVLDSYLKKEEEEGHAPLPAPVLKAFLKGLVTWKRGPRDEEPGTPDPTINNNYILKSLKVALQLKDDDVVEILALAGTRVSKSEVGALLRAEGHRNFQPCKDQFLRNFLRGLTAKYRGLTGD